MTAVPYTYGQGTTLTVHNSGSDPIFVYNFDLHGHAIIDINGKDYALLPGGGSLDIHLPPLTPENLKQYNSASLYFSRSQLSRSLEIGELPDIGNSTSDGGIPFSVFEYGYVPPVPAKDVRGGLNPDFTAVDAFSYPIQWSVTDPNLNNGSGETFTWGLGGTAQYKNGGQLAPLDLLRAWMAATPFTNPRTGAATASNLTDQLIWSDTTSLNNNRIIGPSKLWRYGAGGLPSFLPANFASFITQYPYDGEQLAQAGAFGQPRASAPLNDAGWQVVEPPQKNGPGIDNGYTYSLQQTALALNGISESVVKFQYGQFGPEQTLPSQGSGGFQGFYTYPQENVLGGITYLADQVTTTINVGPLTATSTIGTGGRDEITGSTGSDVISGGYGADRLTGQEITFSGLIQTIVERLTGQSPSKASDLYLYLRADSSQHGSSTRDTITDFHSNDFIDLSAIDADSEKDGRQSFTWIGSQSFSSAPGQLRIAYGRSGSSFLQGDIDGNGSVDFEVQMLGVSDFSQSNLILS